MDIEIINPGSETAPYKINNGCPLSNNGSNEINNGCGSINNDCIVHYANPSYLGVNGSCGAKGGCVAL